MSAGFHAHHPATIQDVLKTKLPVDALLARTESEWPSPSGKYRNSQPIRIRSHRSAANVRGSYVAHTKNVDGCSAEFKMYDVGLSETVSFCSSHTIETHIERQRFARTLDEIRRLDAHGRHVSAFTGPPVPERIRIEVAHGTAACRRALATNDLAMCASIGWDQTDSGRDFECECACACAYESEREWA